MTRCSGCSRFSCFSERCPCCTPETQSLGLPPPRAPESTGSVIGTPGGSPSRDRSRNAVFCYVLMANNINLRRGPRVPGRLSEGAVHQEQEKPPGVPSFTWEHSAASPAVPVTAPTLEAVTPPCLRKVCVFMEGYATHISQRIAAILIFTSLLHFILAFYAVLSRGVRCLNAAHVTGGAARRCRVAAGPSAFDVQGFSLDVFQRFSLTLYLWKHSF